MLFFLPAIIESGAWTSKPVHLLQVSPKSEWEINFWIEDKKIRYIYRSTKKIFKNGRQAGRWNGKETCRRC